MTLYVTPGTQLTTQEIDYGADTTLGTLNLLTNQKWGCAVPTVMNHAAIDLTDQMTKVGRDSRSAKLIFNDPKISSVHCSIERKVDVEHPARSDMILLHDHSTNGTFLFNRETKQLEKIGKGSFKVIESGTEVVLIPKTPNREKISFVVYMQRRGDQMLISGVHKKYDLREDLGSGAFALVKLCIDRNTGEKYACKIVDKNKFKMHSSSRPDSLLDEVRILEKLKHENIVRVYEFFETPNELYIILELISGGDLFDRIISVQRFSETDALFIFRQIYCAVAYIHGQNIIHRDLKPENILLTNKFSLNIKLSDFGLSRIVNSMNQAKTMCGTLQYLAPEVVEQKHAYGQGVDVWSMGVNLYILLCGYPPFDDSEECRVPMYQQMIKSSYSFPDDPWKTISNEGIC